MSRQATDFTVWETVLDTAMEGVLLVDKQGRIRHINTYAASSLGISPAEARGQHFRDVFCPSLPKSRCWINVALSSGEKLRDYHFEMEKQSESRKLVANLTPLTYAESEMYGALISIRTDENLSELKKEQDYHRAILGSLAEGLFTVDRDMRITSFNRAAEEITGWQEGEVLGKRCGEVLGNGTCSEDCPFSLTLRSSKPIMDFNALYRDRCGNALPIKMHTALLYNSRKEAIGGVISFQRRSGSNEIDLDTPGRTHFYDIIGKNKRMQEVYQLMQEVKDSKSTVLLLGESGTGKELVANVIQRLSPRRGKPYVRVNCAAIPDTLLESELFGHMKGAFTDAIADRIGRFELADGGTIFLDEIGDISPSAQLRLLRVLEEGEFQRLGSSETIRVDVRVIAATNRDLWALVQTGSFRDDLYYRLNVIPITLPPLRQRPDDLPYLIEHFIQKYRRITEKPIQEISDAAFDILQAYDYPGNVRELENIIEHAFVRTNGSIISAAKLPYYVRGAGKDSSLSDTAGDEPAEQVRLQQVLRQCQWNRNKAAKMLGMSRTTLWRRMRELNLLEE
jgi:PAS domain S-box-containing protein